MIKSKAFQRVAVAMAAGVLIGAAADRALTSFELRNLTPGQANRQFQRDLLSVLRPMDRYPRGHTLRIHDAGAQTRAAATDYEPLCQRDTISLFYAPTERDGSYENWPMRPYGIRSERSYRFVAEPRLKHLEALDRDRFFRSPFDSVCRKAESSDPEKDWLGWFQAESTEQAMETGFAVLALQEWGKSPDHELMDCRKDEPRMCKSGAFKTLSLDHLSGVGKCPAAKPGERCLQITIFADVYDITVRKLYGPITAEDIVSVSLGIDIVVT